VHLIDRYAYSNRIHTVDPAYKAGLAFIVLMLCLLLNEPLVSSPEAVSQAIILVTRALGAASAMNFLALTTPLVDIVELLRRWHVPLILIDLMTVIYRFIFVLLETLNRIYIAQDSRLGYHTSYFRVMNSAAMLGSRLFIDAFQRSRRLQLALESRGYDGGDLRVLPSRYTFDHTLLWLGGAAVVSLVLAWIIV
jgi:cobalt/nickel transport system permease protein